MLPSIKQDVKFLQQPSIAVQTTNSSANSTLRCSKGVSSISQRKHSHQVSLNSSILDKIGDSSKKQFLQSPQIMRKGIKKLSSRNLAWTEGSSQQLDFLDEPIVSSPQKQQDFYSLRKQHRENVMQVILDDQRFQMYTGQTAQQISECVTPKMVRRNVQTELSRESTRGLIMGSSQLKNSRYEQMMRSNEDEEEESINERASFSRSRYRKRMQSTGKNIQVHQIDVTMNELPVRLSQINEDAASSIVVNEKDTVKANKNGSFQKQNQNLGTERPNMLETCQNSSEMVRSNFTGNISPQLQKMMKTLDQKYTEQIKILQDINNQKDLKLEKQKQKHIKVQSRNSKIKKTLQTDLQLQIQTSLSQNQDLEAIKYDLKSQIMKLKSQLEGKDKEIALIKQRLEYSEKLRLDQEKIKREVKSLEIDKKVAQIKIDFGQRDLSNFLAQIEKLTKIIQKQDNEIKQMNNLNQQLKNRLKEEYQINSKDANQAHSEEPMRKLERQMRQMTTHHRESIKAQEEQLDTQRYSNRILTKQCDLLQKQLESQVQGSEAIVQEQKDVIDKLLHNNMQIGIQKINNQYRKRNQEAQERDNSL